MNSTDQVTFANTVLLVVMGIMLILIVIGIGLFAYRYQQAQATRRQQEATNLATIRFEAERVRLAKESAQEVTSEPDSTAVDIQQQVTSERPRAPRRAARDVGDLPQRGLR